MEKQILKIAVSGGPCAGKSTLMAKAVQYLSDRGVKVLVVPEAPTLLIATMGISPADPNVGLMGFQEFFLDMQLANEKIAMQAAKELVKDQPVAILCDRGRLDAMAYVGQASMTQLLAKRNETLVQARDDYDAVLYMVSAAIGAKEAYTLANNVARMETVEEAQEKDRKTLAAWVGHPHLSIVDNSTGFEEKIDRALKVIMDLFGIPVPQERERKFLISMPDFDLLEKYSPVKSHIVQTYLPSIGDMERRVRQRGAGEDYTFFYTEKTPTADKEVRNEREKKISPREYASLLAQADLSATPIHKDRYCFAYGSQYLELDVYAGEDGRAIVEVELTAGEQEVALPEELNLIREVTGENEFSNHAIALSGGKLPG